MFKTTNVFPLPDQFPTDTVHFAGNLFVTFVSVILHMRRNVDVAFWAVLVSADCGFAECIAGSRR
jgi:hypothetical protein